MTTQQQYKPMNGHGYRKMCIECDKNLDALENMSGDRCLPCCNEIIKNKGLTMKTYKIEAWEEMGGYITIKAKTKEEAEAKAQRHIDDYGMNIADGIEVDVTHRDTHTQGVIS